eukprot:3142723-Prymnesium_polylepis.1
MTAGPLPRAHGMARAARQARAAPGTRRIWTARQTSTRTRSLCSTPSRTLTNRPMRTRPPQEEPRCTMPHCCARGPTLCRSFRRISHLRSAPSRRASAPPGGNRIRRIPTPTRRWQRRRGRAQGGTRQALRWLREWGFDDIEKRRAQGDAACRRCGGRAEGRRDWA